MNHLIKVRVLFDFCTECNSTQRVYLTEFGKSSSDYSDFCLAHVLTFRDFPEGVQASVYLQKKSLIKGGKTFNKHF